MPSSKRDKNHRIESQACNIVAAKFDPATWVVRDVTERDYGVDKIIERFDAGGSSTGDWALLQIKGTDKDPPEHKSTKISFRLSQKTLEYAKRFSIPFILVRCFNKQQKCYFVYLQNYIRIRTQFEEPDWDSPAYDKKGKIKDKKIKIEFPEENVLEGEGIKKIEGFIALEKDRKYFMELFTPLANFSDNLTCLEQHYKAQEYAKFSQAADNMLADLNSAKKIAAQYSKKVDIEVLDNGIAFLKELVVSSPLNYHKNCFVGDFANVTRLLRTIYLGHDADMGRASYEMGYYYY